MVVHEVHGIDRATFTSWFKACKVDRRRGKRAPKAAAMQPSGAGASGASGKASGLGAKATAMKSSSSVSRSSRAGTTLQSIGSIDENTTVVSGSSDPAPLHQPSQLDTPLHMPLRMCASGDLYGASRSALQRGSCLARGLAMAGRPGHGGSAQDAMQLQQFQNEVLSPATSVELGAAGAFNQLSSQLRVLSAQPACGTQHAGHAAEQVAGRQTEEHPTEMPATLSSSGITSADSLEYVLHQRRAFEACLRSRSFHAVAGHSSDSDAPVGRPPADLPQLLCSPIPCDAGGCSSGTDDAERLLHAQVGLQRGRARHASENLFQQLQQQHVLANERRCASMSAAQRQTNVPRSGHQSPFATDIALQQNLPYMLPPGYHHPAHLRTSTGDRRVPFFVDLPEMSLLNTIARTSLDGSSGGAGTGSATAEHAASVPSTHGARHPAFPQSDVPLPAMTDDVSAATLLRMHAHGGWPHSTSHLQRELGRMAGAGALRSHAFQHLQVLQQEQEAASRLMHTAGSEAHEVDMPGAYSRNNSGARIGSSESVSAENAHLVSDMNMLLSKLDGDYASSSAVRGAPTRPDLLNDAQLADEEAQLMASLLDDVPMDEYGEDMDANPFMEASRAPQ